MWHSSTFQLLRFHFSFFLLPVYLFAISQLPQVNGQQAIGVFVILHLLVYPASNGYNSYMDRDDTPIGGLARPLPPTKQLFYVTVAMDMLAFVIALFINYILALGILFYILASRAYSYRGIRLKQYPVIGFLTVFFFQGAVVFFITYYSCGRQSVVPPLLPCLTASLLIGALYPLTQIYQHEADRQDGVTTISYRLGKKGSFIFSMLLFLAATGCMFRIYTKQRQVNLFYLFLLVMLPVVLFFCYWMYQVWQDEKAANFKNSLRMNVIATTCTTIFFTTLILIKHLE